MFRDLAGSIAIEQESRLWERATYLAAIRREDLATPYERRNTARRVARIARERRASGLCVRCGRAGCGCERAAKAAPTAVRATAKRVTALHKARVAAGLCRCCGKPAERGVRCRACADKFNQRERAKRAAANVKGSQS